MIKLIIRIEIDNPYRDYRFILKYNLKSRDKIQISDIWFLNFGGISRKLELGDGSYKEIIRMGLD
jgi:hypothetical protein